MHFNDIAADSGGGNDVDFRIQHARIFEKFGVLNNGIRTSLIGTPQREQKMCFQSAIHGPSSKVSDGTFGLDFALVDMVVEIACRLVKPISLNINTGMARAVLGWIAANGTHVRSTDKLIENLITVLNDLWFPQMFVNI